MKKKFPCHSNPPQPPPPPPGRHIGDVLKSGKVRMNEHEIIKFVQWVTDFPQETVRTLLNVYTSIRS